MGTFLKSFDTGKIESLDLAIDGPVQALAVNGDKLYIGGVFAHVGGIARQYLAEVDMARGMPTDWNPSPNEGVTILLATDGRLYVAGDFTIVAGSIRNQLAAFDMSSGALLDWDAQVLVPYSARTVQALAVSSNAVYIGGNFTGLGGGNPAVISEQ